MSDEVRAAAERLLRDADIRPDDRSEYTWDLEGTLPSYEDDLRTVARAALEAGHEVARLRAALERVLADARTFIVAAESPAEAVPFYEIGAIAKVALAPPTTQDAERAGRSVQPADLRECSPE